MVELTENPIEIKNPIHLARMILDTSSQPLSLRRVPPNLLVGEGATEFAYEHGIPNVPHEVLVSKNARDRFLRWREDLKRAGGSRNTPSTPSSTTGDEVVDLEYEEVVRNKQRRDHTAALLSSTWNEGQPDSPSPSSIALDQESEEPLISYCSQPVSTVHGSTPRPPAKRLRHGGSRTSGQTTLDGNISPYHDEGRLKFVPSRKTPNTADSITLWSSPLSPMNCSSEDIVTDTVGAIAIDSLGRIAAGSSSGGIGMKHRGRVGPAALVGIGTAVIPASVLDPEAITVAAVTSGTGEHMATTMASQKCADRLYHCTKRDTTGFDIPAPEDEVMDSFVRNDFMQHPGVLTSHSAGAIGVMAVKKTPTGYYLHFAHNTDSFALASMHSQEKEPKCVMSRINDQGSVVLGARKIRVV